MARAYRPAINLEPDKETTNWIETLCLVGKVILNKSFTEHHVKSTTTAEWKCKNQFSVSAIDNNMFIFMFQDKHDLNKVFLDSPWSINGGLLTLSPWCSGKLPSELNLSYSPFWVQVHGLPQDYQTEKNGFEIGETLLGKFICVDRNTLNGSGGIIWRKYIRIRIILDVGMPLRTGFWLGRDGLPDIWIVFKYEKLGLFCYKCGRIGHEHRVCKSPARNINFGPWLSAKSVGDGSPVFNSSFPRAEPRVVNRTRRMGVRVSRDVVSVSPLESPANQSLTMGFSTSQPCPEVENDRENHQAMDIMIPRRYLLGKSLINGIDSMVMVMNSIIIRMLITYASVCEGNWRLFLMMPGYLAYLVFKLSQEIRQSCYFGACNVRVSLTKLSIRALVEAFIFIIFLLMLWSA